MIHSFRGYHIFSHFQVMYLSFPQGFLSSLISPIMLSVDLTIPLNVELPSHYPLVLLLGGIAQKAKINGLQHYNKSHSHSKPKGNSGLLKLCSTTSKEDKSPKIDARWIGIIFHDFKKGLHSQTHQGIMYSCCGRWFKQMKVVFRTFQLFTIKTSFFSSHFSFWLLFKIFFYILS